MALSRYTATIVFQFTPLREGRRKHRPQHPDERDISIHAPPRGATMPSPSVTASTNFNSRPSARGDPHGTNLPNSFFISIHAPPRGATHFVSSYGSVLQFQFTPLREGRPADKANHNLPALFQFTPLREGRHGGIRRVICQQDEFQFTPLREGRLLQAVTFHASPHFNSRPSARGDRRVVRTLDLYIYFNSRPSARGDKVAVHATIFFKAFQFTPLREGRRRMFRPKTPLCLISIHAPPRGATPRTP